MPSPIAARHTRRSNVGARLPHCGQWVSSTWQRNFASDLATFGSEPKMQYDGFWCELSPNKVQEFCGDLGMHAGSRRSDECN